jgi:4-amino-4-deoxy-L-arabinose transferase-like glycosyltransferase
MSRTSATFILAVILLAYLSIGSAYAINTPDWQAPDEPAHYNYIKTIVEQHALPILQPGDYDQAYNEQFTRTPKNTRSMSIDPLRYENYAPPLYYLLAAPIYSLADGWATSIRFFSLILGAILIVVAYRIAAELFPSTLQIALGTAAFVAFVPQHLAMMASVNNDSLAELLLALIVLQTIRLFRSDPPSQRSLIILGFTLGLGLLTKTTVYYTALPIVLLALILRARQSALRVSQFALVLVPALTLGALWWIRNLGVYGGFDVLGQARHNAVVVGQPTTLQWINDYGLGGLLSRGLTTTFHSFWGQFGWMAVPMPDSTYLMVGLLSLAAFVGWVWWLVDNRSQEPECRIQKRRPSLPAILLTLLVALACIGLIYYNFTFVQFQGRYLFPALIPIGLVFALGLDHLLGKIKIVLLRLTSHSKRDLTPWFDEAQLLAFAAIFILLARLDLIALQRYILPALAS